MNKQIIKALALKNFSEAKDLVFKSLYAKSAIALDEARFDVSERMFNSDSSEENTEENTEIEENLIGNQKKLDKNNNKKLDKQDFKLLRTKKPVS